MNTIKRYSSILILIFCGIQALYPLANYEYVWDWNTINWRLFSFPDYFFFGTADSAFQVEGAETVDGKLIVNSWTVWEEQEITMNNSAQPRFAPEKRAGKACERWTRYKEDIQLIKAAGMKVHRFSIDWSKIEPQKGVFDEEAMQHYIHFIDELTDNDIEPMPTLFHHIWPLWFEHADDPNRGFCFEDENNIFDFVEFAVYVFKSIYEKVKNPEKIRYWLTFNEPVGQAMAGYVYNLYPPGRKFRIRRCAIVIKNMLDSHIEIYKAFKRINPQVQIGFAHLMHPLHPYFKWNPLDQIPAKLFHYFLNDVAINYFKTGDFNWALLYRDHNPEAVYKIDFIGINYYTHGTIKMFKEVPRPTEKLADGPEGKKGKPFYPEGLYYSIKKAAELNIPIIITENGCASDDCELREEYIRKHLYIISLLLSEGIDIRGYLFWTLTDCFGWNSGKHRKHGIYSVNFTTQERTLRPSSQALLDVVKEHYSR